MSDLVHRLLDRAYSGKGTDPLCEEAARELRRLQDRHTQCLSSLERFAEQVSDLHALVSGWAAIWRSK